MSDEVMERWAKIEQRYNEMDPELRGRYEGMLEAWFWDHPQDAETSVHRIPALQKYGKPGEAEIFLSADDFDLDDFFAVFDYMNSDGGIWFMKPLVEGKELKAVIATTENGPGLPDDWENRAPLDVDEWQEAINEWVAS